MRSVLSVLFVLFVLSGAAPQQDSLEMGSAKIWELRRRAERELGPKFDVRAFHDAVLGSGSMPLSVLERHVEWWIAQQKKR